MAFPQIHQWLTSALDDSNDDIGNGHSYREDTTGPRSPALRRAPQRSALASVDTEHELALRAGIARGDEGAFRTLVLTYGPRLVAYLSDYVKARDVAEDLVQDVFIRMWENHATIDIRSSLAVYLFRAARNAALNYMEQRAVRHRYAVSEQGRANTAEAATVTDIDRDELHSAIARAVAELPPRCREIFILSRDAGLSYKDIAATLGISVNTVNTQISIAIRELRRALTPFLSVLFLINL